MVFVALTDPPAASLHAAFASRSLRLVAERVDVACVHRYERAVETEPGTKVKFKFSPQMRQSTWDGTDEPRPGDLQWYCERCQRNLFDNT